MTDAGGDVPWSVLRSHLDGADETPWPDWLPPRGPGVVAALGHEPVKAEHLGPTPCMSLKAGDIVSLSVTDDFDEIGYAAIASIHSLPNERLIKFNYRGAPHDGWPDEARASMMLLFTSVYRP